MCLCVRVNTLLEARCHQACLVSDGHIKTKSTIHGFTLNYNGEFPPPLFRMTVDTFTWHVQISLGTKIYLIYKTQNMWTFCTKKVQSKALRNEEKNCVIVARCFLAAGAAGAAAGMASY